MMLVYLRGVLHRRQEYARGIGAEPQGNRPLVFARIDRTRTRIEQCVTFYFDTLGQRQAGKVDEIGEVSGDRGGGGPAGGRGSRDQITG